MVNNKLELEIRITIIIHHSPLKYVFKLQLKITISVRVLLDSPPQPSVYCSDMKRTYSLALFDHTSGRIYVAPKSARFEAGSLSEAKRVTGFETIPTDRRPQRTYYLTVVDDGNPDAFVANDHPTAGSQAAVAALLGVSQATVSNALRTGKPVNGVFVTTDPQAAQEPPASARTSSGPTYYLLIEDPDEVPDMHAVQDYPIHTSQQTIADILDTSQAAVSRAIREGTLLNGVFITTDPSATYEGE